MKFGPLVLRILRDPKTIITGVLLGFASGLYLKEFSHSLKPIADIYISLLSMCLLPILVSALIWGIGQILRHPNTKELFGRMAVIYVIGLIIPAAVTIVVALVLQPGALLGEGAATALAVSACPLTALAGIAIDARRTIGFYNLHTGERLTVDYRADGQCIEGALKEIDVILRDFRTGEVRPIDRRLLDCLHALRQNLETVEDFHVISGYRSAKTNGRLARKSGGVAKKSLHTRGMAIDVRIPGIQLSRLRAAARSLKLGGVGYYPKPNFVHLDVGRVRYW